MVGPQTIRVNCYSIAFHRKLKREWRGGGEMFSSPVLHKWHIVS